MKNFTRIEKMKYQTTISSDLYSDFDATIELHVDDASETVDAVVSFSDNDMSAEDAESAVEVVVNLFFSEFNAELIPIALH